MEENYPYMLSSSLKSVVFFHIFILVLILVYVCIAFELCILYSVHAKKKAKCVFI
jgi:hypothetical protein